ncbi:MAG: alpha/beta hydrolase [Acidimicrobiia bacterium]
MRKVLALVLLLSACNSPAAIDDVAPAPVDTTLAPTVETTVFEPQASVATMVTDGLPVEVFAPTEPGPYPVLVTVHGGGWVGGSPDHMAPLADALAGENVVVFNITYTTMSDGGRFPDMVEDVACGVAHARANASEYTTTPERVFIAGFSAGAHLSALVAFAPVTFTCPDGGIAVPDGFIGLAGPYDTDRITILATLFGATIEEAPDTWAAGNPLNYTESAPDIPILLIHGDADTTAPISFTEQLHEALTAAEADVTFEILPGGTHPDAADPNVVGDLVAAFLER